ncbi:MAG: lysophospholipid acyltransferase family protein [Candidatus Omnitrophota bacterium]
MPGSWGARLFLSVFISVLRCLPYFLYRLLAAPLVGAAYLFSGRLHRHALESLSIAYGDHLSLSEKRRIARASFFNLTWGLVDVLYYTARPASAAGRFEVEGSEHLKHAQEAGKGVVVVVAHVGPFAAMLFKFLCEGYRVNVVMRAPRSSVWRHELMAHPELWTPRLIYSTPLRECVASCFNVLKANEFLVMPIDQNYGGIGRVFVDFFGRKAATAAGPAGYAVKTGAALLTAFAEPLKGGRWRIVVEPMLWDASLEERAAVRHLTQALTARVEAQVRMYPKEWSWMHRRWKAVPRENE